MSTTNEDPHVPHVHLPHLHRDSRRVPLDQEPPSANHFISIHESHIPWEGDAPIIHEDERYETLEEEGIPKISEHFHIEHDPIGPTPNGYGAGHSGPQCPCGRVAARYKG